VSATRLLLIGIDAAIAHRWRAFAEAGALPVGQRLLREGVFAENCLPTLPTLTTTNWATISTGAWPGTHGITDFNLHRAGEELVGGPQAFDPADLTAETLWQAAARAGKRTILVNYPGTWPPSPGVSAQIGGAGIEPDEWRVGLLGGERRVSVAADQLFSTEGEEGATPVREFVAGITLPFAFRDATQPVEPGFVLACRPLGRAGLWALQISGPGIEAFALGVGQWSPTIWHGFTVAGTTVAGAFRLKLLDLDPDAGLFRLYVTDICRCGWLQHPAGVLGDVSSLPGLPTPGLAYTSLSCGWIDLDTFGEVVGMATEWLGAAAARLLQTVDWDVFCTHIHAPDSFYHLASHKLEPSLTPDERERARYEAAELTVYRHVDAAVGAILDAAEGPVVTVLVSDHGSTPSSRPVPVARILADAGLLALTDVGRGRAAAEDTLRSGGGAGPRGLPSHRDLTIDEVDWAHTLTVPLGSVSVYVNLKGRDPRGTVSPERYGEVQRRIVDALRAYRDPAGGICPFETALRKEDARVLGLHGDRVGDVIYTLRPEFGEQHGQVLGTGEWPSGAGALRSLLLLAGPGIKRGQTIGRTCWLTDVVPTLCELLGLPVPRQAEGACLHEAFEESQARRPVPSTQRGGAEAPTAGLSRASTPGDGAFPGRSPDRGGRPSARTG
jgi:predicted AlkP superfamily phosphohydrolase/phosphomutase